MSRKICLAAGLLSLPILAGAQSAPLSSLQEDVSFGLMRTAIDAALTVDETRFGPAFSQLESDYLFAGFGNIVLDRHQEAWGTIPFAPENPLRLGYYRAAARPWSAFQSIIVSDGPDRTVNVIHEGVNVETVDLTDHEWFDTVTTTLRHGAPAERVVSQTQFLTRVGPVNLGAYLAVDRMDDITPAANYRRTEIHQYNTAAPGQVPVVDTNYTVTTEETLNDRRSDVTLGFPLFLPTDELAQLFELQLSWMRENLDSFYRVEHTLPQDPTYPQTTHTDEQEIDTFRTNAFTIAPAYTLIFPGFIDTNRNNTFSVGAGLEVTLNSATLAHEGWDQEYHYAPGPDAEAIAGTRHEFEQRGIVSGSMDLGLTAMLLHSVYYEPVDALTFGFAPAATVRYDRGQTDPRNIRRVVTVRRVDNTGDGAFDDPADEIVRSTEDYVDTTLSGDREVEARIAFDLSLPASLRIQPEGWRFGLTVGSALSASITRIGTTVYQGYQSGERETFFDGTGAVTSDSAAIHDVAYAPDRTVTHQWAFQADHRIGLHFLLPADARIDVELRLANLLEFGPLRIQGTVPLN